MRPIAAGDRGAAVEDIQRRLLLLGYDLGPTSIDGVFLGATLSAIEAFQDDRGLIVDGMVGEKTWSALVDATFTFGDRMLYLRVPYLHGHDVRVLQEALGVLGFSTGIVDGIFGAFTERAVRDFQRNVGLAPDGIVGPDSVQTLLGLRHLWEGRESARSSGARYGAARAGDVLSRVPFAILPEDDSAQELAARVLNLAMATTEDARVALLAPGERPDPDARLLLRLAESGTDGAIPGTSLVMLTGPDDDTFAARLTTAIASGTERPREVVVDLSGVTLGDERMDQQVAVLLLDAVCLALA